MYGESSLVVREEISYSKFNYEGIRNVIYHQSQDKLNSNKRGTKWYYGSIPTFRIQQRNDIY